MHYGSYSVPILLIKLFWIQKTQKEKHLYMNIHIQVLSFLCETLCILFNIKL